MVDNEKDTLRIQYKYEFQNGREVCFELNIDIETMLCVDPVSAEPPDWVALDFFQCAHCPLNVKEHEHCPAALRLSNIVKELDQIVSFDEVHVEVTTDERFVSLDTSAQKGISSLMGLVMATSGCPHAAFFRPMARYHLPFARQEETTYRATSMYMLAQYFVSNEGRTPDLELEGLTRLYENMETLNVGIAKRLRAANETDSAVNAVVILDMYAKTCSMEIESSVKEIRYLFSAYLDETRKLIRD